MSDRPFPASRKRLASAAIIAGLSFIGLGVSFTGGGHADFHFAGQ